MDPSARCFIPKPPPQPTTTGPVMSYFANFPTFVPDPTTNLQLEFARLAIDQGWGRKSKKHTEEWRKACEDEFEIHFGATIMGGTLAAWQSLCEELGVEPTPVSITQCKKALRKVHVNLVDLINKRRHKQETGVEIQIKVFQSHGALVQYTRQSKKFFPKIKAKQNELLKILLRRIGW